MHLTEWIYPLLLLLVFLMGAGVTGTEQIKNVTKAITKKKAKPQIETKPKNMVCGCNHHRAFHSEQGCAGPIYNPDGSLNQRLCSCQGYISSMAIEDIATEPFPVRNDNHPSLMDIPRRTAIESGEGKKTDPFSEQDPKNSRSSRSTTNGSRSTGTGTTKDVFDLTDKFGRRR